MRFENLLRAGTHDNSYSRATNIINESKPLSVFSIYKFIMNVVASKSGPINPIVLLDESYPLEETTSLQAADALIFQNQEDFNPRFLSSTTATATATATATETTSDTANSTMSFKPVEFSLFSFNLLFRDLK